MLHVTLHYRNIRVTCMLQHWSATKPIILAQGTPYLMHWIQNCMSLDTKNAAVYHVYQSLVNTTANLHFANSSTMYGIGQVCNKLKQCVITYTPYENPP